MIDRQTNPLELARRVLEPETIREIRYHEGLGRGHYLILDRWALNEPENLKALEILDPEDPCRFLFFVLAEQDTREEQALCSYEGIQMRMSGMSDWEILEQFGVDTRLGTPRQALAKVSMTCRALEPRIAELEEHLAKLREN